MSYYELINQKHHLPSQNSSFVQLHKPPIARLNYGSNICTLITEFLEGSNMYHR